MSADKIVKSSKMSETVADFAKQGVLLRRRVAKWIDILNVVNVHKSDAVTALQTIGLIYDLAIYSGQFDEENEEEKKQKEALVKLVEELKEIDNISVQKVIEQAVKSEEKPKN